MANRLAASTSPYLQQHADNPVDWYPWGEDAFAAARDRDVPIFLSVGYAACHWCHVMAHESFEDPATAAVLNAGFVPVKVDREERPDVDAVYMGATQAMTGQGGWPMSVMLTAQGEPFYAGTYYPPEPRHGMPSFRQVLDAVSEAWRDRRTDIEQVGAEVSAHLRQSAAGLSGRADEGTEVDLGSLGEHAVRSLAPTFDEARGGFGGAPKFPPSMVCEFLLRRAARVGDQAARQMADATMEAMARGGIYDQLAGGFARYSVDADWRVPHFEKMLYDNALLLSAYLHWWRLSGSALGERVARETAEFLLREMRTPEGGFASALDADSDGREGAFYVWTPDELRQVLGEEAGTTAAERFQVTALGSVDGASTLLLPRDPADAAQHREMVALLLAARERRTRPARDDKVVAAWNGLAVGALAEAGILLRERRFLEAAVAAAQLLVGVHLSPDGRLRRVSRDGTAGEPTGVLEDYACVAEGFLSLFAATGDAAWFHHAKALTDQVLERFSDGAGGFFDTAVDAEQLVSRPQDPTDNATPSGSATMASVFTTLFGLTGEPVCQSRAVAVVHRVAALARQAPRFAGKALAVAEALADGPRQVAVVGADGEPARGELLRAAFRLPSPGLVIAQGDGVTAAVPLLESRGPVEGKSAAYLCHDFVCDLPVTDPAALAAIPT